MEPPLLTLGQDLNCLPQLAAAGADYSAADVVAYLLRTTG
ncbi:hypothetical protein Val02_72380 [Virgisporangium aliadipatigenens]|uniref:Uncharacterized protein n=1 Tax=Virgisporangium aliadipatigenens TaxID=741659 RepID=A0A8J4DVQ0_9ACTN|nr:hypothetical protein Val02_72380 [Virgisporangium aliadipatigenens]